jgi:elongation factor Tu
MLGRKKPITSGYRPQAFIRTADVACEVTLGDGVMGMPGDNL